MTDRDPSDFLQELPLGVWVARVPNGEFVYANGAFADIMGMTARGDVAAGGYAEPYGIFDRTGGLYPEERMPFVQAMRARAPVVVDDIVIHRRDGRQVFVRALAKPLFGADGAMTHVVIAFTDMTAEVEANRDRELAESRLRTAVQHAPIVLFAYDREGVVTMAEGLAMQKLRMKPAELVGRSVFEAFPDNADIMGAARRALAGETVTHRASVEGTEFEAWLAPVRDEQGAIAGAIGVATDVTDLVRMQGGIAQADRMVALGTLAAGVAHELNNPLAYVIESLAAIEDVITLLAHDLERMGAREGVERRLSRLRQFAGHAREGAERMRVVTRDLRTFSRTEEEKPVPLDPRAAVASALHLVRKKIETQARIVTHLEAVPPVLATEARLAQVLVNLAINAAQAIPPGSPPDRNEVHLATRHDGDFVWIEVADTGPGVPPEIRERLFEPFFTTKAADGTGLGLFVSRNIVQSFGGRIEVGDRPGGGAVFRIALPVAPGGAVAAAACIGPEPVAERARVLVVEDDTVLAEVMRNVLAGEFDVRIARTGAEALDALAESEAWDLTLCDLMLKDMTGMDVYDELRRRKPGREASLVFMTGGAFTPRARQFLASVPNDRLEKPFDVRAEVRKRVRR